MFHRFHWAVYLPVAGWSRGRWHVIADLGPTRGYLESKFQESWGPDAQALLPPGANLVQGELKLEGKKTVEDLNNLCKVLHDKEELTAEEQRDFDDSVEFPDHLSMVCWNGDLVQYGAELRPVTDRATQYWAGLAVFQGRNEAEPEEHQREEAFDLSSTMARAPSTITTAESMYSALDSTESSLRRRRRGRIGYSSRGTPRRTRCSAPH